MNIFYLDKDLEKCAQYHVDKHVVKMIVESCQILSNAHHVKGTKKPPMKMTHENHPCCIWARESRQNYIWLCQFTLHLLVEYIYRYRKPNEKNAKTLFWLCDNIPDLPNIGLTEHAQGMRRKAPECLREGNPILAYRLYYILHKNHIAKWKNRSRPDWYSEQFLQENL